MDHSLTQPPPPAPASQQAPPPRKGMGTGAKIGIGCGAIVLLGIVIVIILSVIYGDRIRNFAEEAQRNPTRATATMMVSTSRGGLEMVAEDDENRRYTLRDTETGKLTTIYWNEAKQAPEVIEGDFSAIPAPGGVLLDDTPDASSAPDPDSP